MANQSKDKKQDKDKKKPFLKDDPQENMEGPVSSIMQNLKEVAESNDEETKEEADRRKDKNT